MSDEQGPAIEVTVGDDHVATIEIRRPPNNFFSMDVIGGIADALAECDNNDAVRVAVLCAEGKHFCGGADFSPCLLYTSPSPRDATLSRMPSSA